MDLVVLIQFSLLVFAGWFFYMRMREKAHPHFNRANWTESELRDHLKEYHPDIYKHLIEIEKENNKNG